MSVSFYDLTVGSYIQIVESSMGFMEKARAHFDDNGIDLANIVEARIHPDMANLHFQVTSVTHHSIAALKGIKSGEFSPPNYPDADYAKLQAMTASTLAELKVLTEEEVNALAGNSLVFKLGDNVIPFTAENFVLSFSLPNFHFHATTAYDILRAQGAPIGKRDFLGAIKIGA